MKIRYNVIGMTAAFILFGICCFLPESLFMIGAFFLVLFLEFFTALVMQLISKLINRIRKTEKDASFLKLHITADIFLLISSFILIIYDGASPPSPEALIDMSGLITTILLHSSIPFCSFFLTCYCLYCFFSKKRKLK